MLLAQQLTAIISLWLAGVALRLTILAIPPVITLIRDDLNLSPTQVGVLTGLPVSLFAVAAVIGSLLIARIGARPALLIGLFTTAIGSSLRSASTEVAMLYATTTLMALGVAIMQPALPPLVRSWLPARTGFGTAVYTNGLLAGEIAPVVITPFVLPLMDTSWRFSLVVWRRSGQASCNSICCFPSHSRRFRILATCAGEFKGDLCAAKPKPPKEVAKTPRQRDEESNPQPRRQVTAKPQAQSSGSGDRPGRGGTCSGWMRHNSSCTDGAGRRCTQTPGGRKCD